MRIALPLRQRRVADDFWRSAAHVPCIRALIRVSVRPGHAVAEDDQQLVALETFGVQPFHLIAEVDRQARVLGQCLSQGDADVIAVMVAVSNEGETDIFIASDQPVTEDQVRAKLRSEGWTAIHVTKDERYIEATAAKGGRVARLMIDSLTGQLIADDRDED